MFSATERFGHRLTSWYTVLMPSFCASSGDAGRIGKSSSRISPPDEASTPVSTLMSVDLPAPFCPIKAWISPG